MDGIRGTKAQTYGATAFTLTTAYQENEKTVYSPERLGGRDKSCTQRRS